MAAPLPFFASLWPALSSRCSGQIWDGWAAGAQTEPASPQNLDEGPAPPSQGAAAAFSPKTQGRPSKSQAISCGRAAPSQSDSRSSAQPPRDLTFAADIELGHLHACLRTLCQLPPTRRGKKINQKAPRVPPTCFSSYLLLQQRQKRWCQRAGEPRVLPPTPFFKALSCSLTGETGLGEMQRGCCRSLRPSPESPSDTPHPPHSPPPSGEGADRLQELPVPPLVILLRLAHGRRG